MRLFFLIGSALVDSAWSLVFHSLKSCRRMGFFLGPTHGSCYPQSGANLDFLFHNVFYALLGPQISSGCTRPNPTSESRIWVIIPQSCPRSDLLVCMWRMWEVRRATEPTKWSKVELHRTGMEFQKGKKGGDGPQEDENREGSGNWRAVRSIWARVDTGKGEARSVEGRWRGQQEMRAGWGWGQAGNMRSSHLTREERRQKGCRVKELFLGHKLHQNAASDSPDHFACLRIFTSSGAQWRAFSKATGILRRSNKRWLENVQVTSYGFFAR